MVMRGEKNQKDHNLTKDVDHWRTHLKWLSSYRMWNCCQGQYLAEPDTEIPTTQSPHQRRLIKSCSDSLFQYMGGRGGWGMGCILHKLEIRCRLPRARRRRQHRRLISPVPENQDMKQLSLRVPCDPKLYRFFLKVNHRTFWNSESFRPDLCHRFYNTGLKTHPEIESRHDMTTKKIRQDLRNTYSNNWITLT